IVAEVASWGDARLEAFGLGAYIARATAAGDFHRIVLGIAVMSLFVVVINRAFWRPLYRLAERKFRLEGKRMDAAAPSLLEVQSIRKAFPKPDGSQLLVLDDLNLKLAEGEIVGLLGRSGSGKSTLLRLIAGLAQPTTETIMYLGRRVEAP